MQNLVYDTILKYAPADRRRTTDGWQSFNAVCCLNNGERRPDTRRRAGVNLTDENMVVYHCFNCKYKASWVPGRKLSQRMKNLLEWLLVPYDERRKLEFKVWQIQQRMQADLPEPTPTVSRLLFGERVLPEGAMSFDHWLKPENLNEEFLNVAQYLADRGDAILGGYQYYWSPSKEHSLNKRVIIPFYWKGKTVGYTARAIFPTKHRYFADTQTNYIFNTESILQDNKYIIVTEGPFDAIAVNGVAMLGDKLTPSQSEWLNQQGKTIVVLPDRTNRGGKLVDVALEHGWNVSFPSWDDGIKDAAEACRKYGKLYTVWSVIDARVSHPLEINVKRNWL